MTAALRDNLKARMAEKVLGIRPMARAAGLDHGPLSRFLAGKKDTLALDSVAALAAALDTTVGQLLGEPTELVDVDHMRLRLDQIDVGEVNPRGYFDHDRITELAQSIGEHGVLQNIVVRQSLSAGRYELIAGERRVRACLMLADSGDWPESWRIPAVLIAADDSKHLVLALLENLQREDLRPFEEARAFSKLRDDLGWNTEKIAAAIHRTQRHVQQRLQLLTLAPAAQHALCDNLIGPAVARHLARLPEPGQQSMIDRIKAGTLPADEQRVRQAVGAWLAAKEATDEARQSSGQIDIEERFDDAEAVEPESYFQDAQDWLEAPSPTDWPAKPNKFGVYPHEICQLLFFEDLHGEAEIRIVQAKVDGLYRASFSYSLHMGGGAGGLPSNRDPGHEHAPDAVAQTATALANSMADISARGHTTDRAQRTARHIFVWARGIVEDLEPDLLDRITAFRSPARKEAPRDTTPAPPANSKPDIPAPAPAETVAAVRDGLSEQPWVALRVLAASMMECHGPVRIRPMLASTCHSELGRHLDQNNDVWREISKVYQGGELVELKGNEDTVGVYEAVKLLPTDKLLELLAHLTAIRIGPADCVDWQGKSLLGLIYDDLGLELHQKGEAAQ